MCSINHRNSIFCILPPHILVQIAKNEGRSLAQVCEILLRGGVSLYKEEGPRYLQRLVSRQKKEPSQ